jgi:hypothetical protein
MIISCVNETLTTLDGAVDYHGDWSYNSTTQRINYIGMYTIKHDGKNCWLAEMFMGSF